MAPVTVVNPTLTSRPLYELTTTQCDIRTWEVTITEVSRDYYRRLAVLVLISLQSLSSMGGLGEYAFPDFFWEILG